VLIVERCARFVATTATAAAAVRRSKAAMPVALSGWSSGRRETADSGAAARANGKASVRLRGVHKSATTRMQGHRSCRDSPRGSG
jgi:hypothetical protein